jgi:hypothetical protein
LLETWQHGNFLSLYVGKMPSYKLNRIWDLIWWDMFGISVPRERAREFAMKTAVLMMVTGSRSRSEVVVKCVDIIWELIGRLCLDDSKSARFREAFPEEQAMLCMNVREMRFKINNIISSWGLMDEKD